MNKLMVWIEELRAPFFTATIISLLLGTVMAWARTSVFHLGYFLLVLFGGVCLHAGTNIANDYFDHKSGNDETNTEYIRPFSGGSRLIQKGALRPREVLVGSLIFLILGSSIGLYLAWARGMVILLLGVIGVFSGFFYSAPPFKLANRGVGELLVGINFGILMTVGAYFVQTQSFSWEPFVASLPVAFLISAILYINEFPDFKADMATGKKHLVVRLGKKRAAFGFILILCAVYLSMILGVAFKMISPFALLGLLTLPIALKAMQVARFNFNDTSKLVPANAGTILIHLLTGGLIIVGYAVHKLILG
jgi:1,4-dihydroxy-2-naphthoate octaprenyltransferase